jgi:uncharacterized protein YjbI with pentapeptide repeats
MRRLLRLVRRRAGSVRWAVVVGIAGGLLLVAVLLAVIVFVPQQAIDPSGLSRGDWLKAVQDLRTSILQGLGGLAVLAGAVVAALTLRVTSRQNRAVFELQRRGQTTERFTRAIDQLGQQGPEKLDVRIGAVYALEQIARDSAELHWPIMEVLTAYLREHAPVSTSAEASTTIPAEPPGKRMPADHQAIATVVGRRRRTQDPDGQHLDLSGTNLSDVRWHGAHLEGANLTLAHLPRANLYQVHLEKALLLGAHLESAILTEAHLEEARLALAHLEGAALWRTHLEGANLRMAHLQGASLVSTHLERADLSRAHLEEAELSGMASLEREGLTGAQLERAQQLLEGEDLTGAHLEGADLTGAHLKGADLEKTLGLTREQLRVAADPEQARLSPEQAAWLAPAAGRPPAAGSEVGPEDSGGADPDHR